jgi:hypothetical protein
VVIEFQQKRGYVRTVDANCKEYFLSIKRSIIEIDYFCEAINQQWKVIYKNSM